jgi:hypothetical protein
MEEDIYKQKYLKYKKKYLNLVEQYGGLTMNDGIKCFFTSEELANQIKSSPKVPKLSAIVTILNNQAYVINDGESKLDLVISKSKSKSKKSDESKESDESEQRPLVVPVRGRDFIFNRCDTKSIEQVKRVLGSYDFVPEVLLTIKISKTSSNKILGITKLT